MYFLEASMGTTINAQTEDSEYVRAVYRWEGLIIVVIVLRKLTFISLSVP